MRAQEFIKRKKPRKAKVNNEIDEAGLTYKGYPCTKDCSGHMAGDKWAQTRGTQADQCPLGGSNSWWEGCKSWSEYK